MKETLGLVAIAHELGMAIGLDIRLKPMLRAFTRVCLKRLALAGINVYFDGKHSLEPAPPLLEPQPLYNVFSIPELHVGNYADVQRTYTLLQQDKLPWLAVFCPVHNEHIYHFPLNRLGLISLRRKGEPLAHAHLELLIPIFKRLTISCIASLEHEQLLTAIEARKAAESRIVFQLYHDDLTLLPNRRALMEALEHELTIAREQGLQGALLFIDLDRFKAINDALGHAAGDELLKAVAEALQQAVRKQDHVARLSGDEFVVVLTNVKPGEAQVRRVVDIVLDKIRTSFAHSVRAGEHLLHVSPSIGVELFPRRDVSADRVLRNADTAMYVAKSQGHSAAVYYEDSMSADLDVRLEVEKELQVAIKTCEPFKLVYQPQYNHRGQLIGAEALLRWQGKTGGEISPVHFIPVAEETGLMLELGRWVTREACAQLRKLQQLTLPPTFEKISINVSAVQFNQANYVEELLDTVRRAAIKPQLLGIELTESALITNVKATRDKMVALQEHGIDVSVDDFGTGYSSLSYLNRFPIKTLKIDQAFVRNANKDAGNRAIVETIIALAKSLNLNVIAEGVETFDELDCLKQLHCYHYQGYYFSKPLEFADFCALVGGRDHGQSSKIKTPRHYRRHTDKP